MLQEAELTFYGSDYVPEYDQDRLSTQLTRIIGLMRDEQWRGLQEISDITGAPPASASAGLRVLRRKENGGHTVNKRRAGSPYKGMFEYQLIWNENEF